jgi:DNA-binding XRE family transcriptional regulator
MTKFSLEKARKSSKKFNAKLEKNIISNPETKALYERKHREIELALLMKKTREKANLSQEDVAERMHTTRSAVSRLEACGSGRHSPSIDTLLKYAQALGYAVKINLVPIKEKSVSK